MLEIHMLEHIATFAETGTLSASADKLCISQPALTRSMQKLEKVIGVKLFNRQKNRITLNENGILTAEYANSILQQSKNLIEAVRAFDRSKHTISIGSCTPVPLSNIVSILTKTYDGMIINSEVNTDSLLEENLQNDLYDIIITHYKIKSDKLISKKCGSENLYFSLPKNHNFSKRKSLYLKELDGESILIYSKIGFWYELCKKEMPNAKFLMQHNRETFKELVKSSAFPFFTTDIMIKTGNNTGGQINIPVLDKEANVTYYAVCKKEKQNRFKEFFDNLGNNLFNMIEF